MMMATAVVGKSTLLNTARVRITVIESALLDGHSISTQICVFCLSKNLARDRYLNTNVLSSSTVELYGKSLVISLLPGTPR